MSLPVCLNTTTFHEELSCSLYSSNMKLALAKLKSTVGRQPVYCVYDRGNRFVPVVWEFHAADGIKVLVVEVMKLPQVLCR